ncbi:uncharacterized protein LOC132060895 [Lycium ferocissimum]|uniref:uncharacterized protein LOC132060895 n=1 Tax=Lycium ferocissimum TaxID=112874 RepID=UPI002815B477|nr:uncharacterized protein LOC132060895 [Lycium ferocissimum]
MAVLEELPVKQRAPKGNIIERLLSDCPLENARSWTRESNVTSGHFIQRIRLYYGVKIGYASGGFAAVCMSYLNTNLIIIASLPHNFRIQLPNRSLNLHLPIATCHLQDYSACNSVVVNLDVVEPSSNQQHQHQVCAFGPILCHFLLIFTLCR